MVFTREQLRERHRMSHKQIDDFLHENKAKDYLDEKLRLLDFVCNFVKITDLLGDNGVEFIPLKGPILSQRLYGDPTIRIYHDIDLLINKNEISKAISLLQGNDFVINEMSYWSEDQNVQKMFEALNNHVSLIHKKTGIILEIHWSLSLYLPINDSTSKKIVKENTVDFVAFNRKYKILSPELEFIYLAIHGTSHAWQRIKWVADIHEYSKQNLDKTKLDSLIKTLNAEIPIALAKEFSEMLFDSKFLYLSVKKAPDWVKKYCVDKLLSDSLTIHGAKARFLYFIFKLKLFNRLSYKLKILNTLLLYRDDIVKNKFGYVSFYYFIRPISFVKRKVLRYLGV